MATNLPIRNSGGQVKYLKVTGTGTDGDPYIIVTSGGGGGSGDASAANQTTQITAEQAIQAGVGATSDAVVAAGASGSLSAKLRAISRDLIANIVLAAGENHLGAVGGHTVTPSGTMTRPADTTAYAAGDGVTTATSSASAMSVSNAARTSAGSGMIFGGQFSKSTTGTTNASFRGWIYQDTPSAVPNDNAAFTAAVHADYQKLVGTFTCDLSSVGIVGSDGVSGPITLSRTNLGFKLASGTALTVILEARGAYTPSSAEVFRLKLDITQD